jgi:HEAT repeat protein
VAYILLFGLFLQSCNNPYLSIGPNKQELIEKNQIKSSTPTLIQGPFPATVNPAELKEHADTDDGLAMEENELSISPDSSLEKNPATSKSLDLAFRYLEVNLTKEQKDASKQDLTSDNSTQLAQAQSSLSAHQETNARNLKPSELFRNKSNQETATGKSVLKGIQAQRRLSERQEKAREKGFEQTEQAGESALMLTKGRYQMEFKKTASGQWKAVVNEVFQVGISRKLEWPVFFELGYNISHVADSHLVHIVHQDGGSFIWVGTVGIKGGMKNELDDNNNSNSSKQEVIPSELSGKLKYLYQQDETLPKLIEDEDIPEQRIQDYYVKLQVVLQENLDQGRSAAARDQVVGEKRPLEVEKLFDEIDKDHPAVSKILLLGGAGIGKSTLMHYISHQWANGKLWKDKYEHVFRVRLKDLLDSSWLSDYNREEKEDLLACFIHRCLYTQRSTLQAKLKGNKQLKEIRYKFSDIQELLKDAVKNKVLLLVDGYDEIVSLKDKPEYTNVVELGVFEHPQVIMTSRPHAASKEVRAKFERQVESQGLDEEGIKQYISLQFKQEPDLGESLKGFLFNNSQVKSICKVPINTALICIIWKDPAARAKLSSSTSMQANFKLGQLYHGLIVWLGKRYAQRYKPAYSNQENLRELSDKAVLEDKVFRALECIAYKAFTGQLKNESESSGALGIPGESIDEVAKEVDDKLSISELHKYGLLRGEGDPNKPLEQTYEFIHLTFQEYLTAHRLCKLLSQENKVEVAQVATWLAHHRNEPRYLMTLKFLAGLVSQSKDERLVKRFWEAMSCNVDGVIELGVEGKVNLFMHLLSQSKVGGQFDKRIPNLDQIAKLVDGTLQGDLIKWQQAIIEIGYFPTWLQEATSKGLKEGIGLARKSNLSEKDRLKLQIAAELLTKMASTGVIHQEYVFRELMELMRLQDWRLQRLGLEKVREVVDETVNKKLLEESIALAVALLTDENLGVAAKELLARIAAIDAGCVFKHLKPLLADSHEAIREKAAQALLDIVELAPKLRKEGIEALINLLADENYGVRSTAADTLPEILKLVPELIKEVFESLKPLLADENYGVQSSAVNALPEIIKLVPKLRKEGFQILKPLLANEDYSIRSSAVDTLLEIVKLMPELGKEAWEALKPLLADEDDNVRNIVAYHLGLVVQSLPELGKEMLEALKPLLTDRDDKVRSSAAKALRHIVRLVPDLRKEGFQIFKPLLANEDYDVRSSAVDALPKIVELVPKLGKELFEALKPLLAHSNEDIRKSADETLSAIVKSVPKLRKKLFEPLKNLLDDENYYVRTSAVNALGTIVKLVPELREGGFKIFKPLLTDEHWYVRGTAVDALRVIVQSVPKLREEVFEALKPLLVDEDHSVNQKVIKAVEDLVKLVPKLKEKVFEELELLLANEVCEVRAGAATALPKIVKLMPSLEERGFRTLKELLFCDKDKYVRSSAADALGVIVQSAPKLKQEGLDVLKPLLDDEDKYVRSSAADALLAIVASVPEPRKEGTEALKPLLDDSNKNARKRVVDILPKTQKLIPGLEKEVFEALKLLLADENKDIRSGVAKGLGAILKLIPEEEGIKALKSLLANSRKDVQSSAADALGFIVQSALELRLELKKEVFEALKPLLNNDKDDNVRSSAAKALEHIMRLAPELGEEGFQILKPLLYNNKDYGVRSCAAGGLLAIVKLVPGLRKELFGSLKSLLGDEDDDVRICAAKALGVIVQLVPELRKEGIESLKPLLADEDYIVQGCATNALRVIVQSVLPPRREVIEELKPLLTDKDDNVRSSAASILPDVVQLVPFTERASLVTDAHPEVRNQAKEALAATLKYPAEIAQLNHQAVGSLLEIIRETRDQQEELAKALCTGATKALASIAKNLSLEGLAWLNEHLNNLQSLSLPEAQAFLKAVIHHALQDGMIDAQETQLLINCIVARGLSAIIDPQANKITLEDNTYVLQPASQEALNHVVNQVIRLSKDAIAAQYKAHTPLFKNSGEALPLATADIEKAGSILDKTVLDSESWHVSLLDLSDHHQGKPGTTFILLEQRSYAGEHIIKQIKLDKGGFVITTHSINPLAVDKLKEALFGPMEYITIKPRYYGLSFTLSQELGKKLLAAAQQTKPRVDSYIALHELAREHQPSNGLLSLPWEEYIKHIGLEVKEYKKEEVLTVDAKEVRRHSIFIASQEHIKDHDKVLEVHEEGMRSHKKELEENKNKIESNENKLVALVGQVSKQEQQISDQHIRLDKQELKVEAHEQQIKDIHSILDLAGVQGDAEVKGKLQQYKNKEKELFNYCSTFIWTLKAYMDAYLVASSGLLATNQESSKAEEIAYKTGRNVVTGALDLVPFVGGFLSGMVGDALDSTRAAIHQAKQDNKIAAINRLMTKDHARPSELEHSIAQAALKIAERNKASIITPPTVNKTRLGQLGEKISALTDKLLKKHQIAQSPQAELAVKDVVALMIRLYQEYELSNENRTNATFADQLAELVCKGSLEDMMAKLSSKSSKLDVSLVKDVFQEETLKNLREKAAKGLWKASRLNPGKECEEFFKEKFIKENLIKNKKLVNNETLSASRAVLFQAMCEGMVATEKKKPKKVLECAQEFAKEYPTLASQIASDYPTYFADRKIAEKCIDDQVLLAKVQSQLPPVSKFK